jgi:hypothetical protein
MRPSASGIHGAPDPSELPQRTPGEPDPPDPRKNVHRPTEAPPLEDPAVKKLRPLELVRNAG